MIQSFFFFLRFTPTTSFTFCQMNLEFYRIDISWRCVVRSVEFFTFNLNRAKGKEKNTDRAGKYDFENMKSLIVNTVESIGLIYLYPRFSITRKGSCSKNFRISLTKALVPVPVVSFFFVHAFLRISWNSRHTQIAIKSRIDIHT